MKALDIREILAPTGPIAQKLSGFEKRPQQVQMACAIKEAFADGCHLVAEAGTGIGKSFAYLIPVIELLCKAAGKVLVSTFTITLQEQLINKDIPFLADCLPAGFTAVLAKGRGNYLCKRRLEFVLRRQAGLFDAAASELEAVKNWASQTKDGSLSCLTFVPKSNVWDAVRSEHGNCRGRKCPHFGDCFYWRARRRLECADIIVANHALLFSDLVLKAHGASVLPDYRYVVVDEAHNIEHVAEEHFGINISNYTVKFLLDGLYNPRAHKGLLVYMDAVRAIDMVSRAAAGANAFFKQVRHWYGQAKDETNGRCYRNFVDDKISGHLKNLRAELAKLAKRAEDIDERFELVRFVDRCTALVEDLNDFLLQQRPDYVYWVEQAVAARAAIRLRSAPLNVGPDVKKCLFDIYGSVILTSATLSSGSADDKEGFDFFTGRIGLHDFRSVKLGSPFDYQKQVTVYIEKHLPDPNEPAFLEPAAKAVKKYVLQTAGRAFVLFTSYEMLDILAQSLAEWFIENEIELLQQGAGLDRTVLLERFKTERNCVLFGTDSFWQGVDVPGEALSNVIIVRLPFAVPDQPLIAGRLEQIRQQGGNPFYDYQLPSAILKFKQGFGRLIRSKTDTGIVVVLDSRVLSKSYGQKFLTAIPNCRIKVVSEAKL
ncbi:MAG: helicase [Planctomycetota bacterium]|nr:MAG: helicase [Planctomycetota bacterium]